MTDPTVTITLGRAQFSADLSGALFWPGQATLIVADLHFEKATSYAAHGRLLPPYDTRATLDGLAAVIARYRPQRVICLGDSFHDMQAEARMQAEDRARLAGMIEAVEWVWIAGNHDPEAANGLGGTVAETLTIDDVGFRHQALSRPNGPEVSGHFHPKARIATGPRRVSRPCFVEDGRRAILPAFGAFTGGLDVTDPAVRGLFDRSFSVHLLGRDRFYSFPVAAR